MLHLRTGKIPARIVELDGGATITVRPATAFEVSLAQGKVARQLAGLLAAQDGAMLAMAALGDEFRGADFTKPEWVNAASQQLALIELSEICVEACSGMALDGVPVEKPSRTLLAMLLRDHAHADRISSAIQSPIYEQVAEGNGSPASPGGGAGTAELNAPIAAAPGSLAPKA